MVSWWLCSVKGRRKAEVERINGEEMERNGMEAVIRVMCMGWWMRGEERGMAWLERYMYVEGVSLFVCITHLTSVTAHFKASGPVFEKKNVVV